MIGKTISHYKILEKLGEGGMGEVYLAEDTKLDRKVALKFLPKAYTTDQTAKERFKREAKAAAALNHPNIVTIHEINEHDDQIYIAMEYVEGQTLKKKISGVGAGHAPAHKSIGSDTQQATVKITHTLDEITHITTQICQGLQKAHEAGIIHRDIKPQNIIINKDGQVKILDFGLAKLKGVSQLTKESSTMGTIHYMSPEQASGEELDFKTDIWSIGVVLYEMLAGELPFKGDYPQAIIYAILNEKPESIKTKELNVPALLEQLVYKALEKNPQQRFNDCREMINQLKMLNREKQSRKRIKAKPIKRYQTLKFKVVTGIILVLALGIVLAWIFLNGDSTPGESKSTINPNKVLITLFENQTGEPAMDSLGRMITESIIQKFMEFGKGEVIPMTMVMQIAKTTKNLQDINVLEELANKSGAGIAVTGTLYADGENLRIHSSITDMKQKKLVHSIQPIKVSRKQTSEIISLTCQRVMGALAMYFDVRFPNLGAFKSPTFDAYLEYSKALEIFTKDDLQAIYHFERAAELDPDFTMAKLAIVIVYFSRDEFDKGDKFFRSLKLKMGRFTFIERTAVNFIQAWAEGSWGKCLRFAERINTFIPREPRIAFMVALFSILAKKPKQAINLFLKMGAMDFKNANLGYLYFRFLTESQHLLEEFEEELKIAWQSKKMFPDQLRMLYSEIRALAAIGKVKEVRDLINQSLSSTSKEGSPGTLMMIAATELREHQHMKEYAEVAEMAVSWFKDRFAEEKASENPRFQYAVSLYTAEKWSDAALILNKLSLENPKNLAYRGYLGAIAARMGDKPKANQIIEQLKQVKRPYLFGEHSYWCARISALLGKKESAINFLRQAFSQGLQYGEALLRELDFESLRDIPAFIELLRPIG